VERAAPIHLVPAAMASHKSNGSMSYEDKLTSELLRMLGNQTRSSRASKSLSASGKSYNESRAFSVGKVIEQRRSTLARSRTSTNTAPETVSALHSSEVLCDWDRPIGRGTFGAVYKGLCRGQPVVAKKLTLNPESVEEFEHEVDTMVKLRHPNVVLFMGACAEPTTRLIVMEFLPRGSVGDMLDKNLQEPAKHTPPSFELRMRMAEHTAKGMNWLHCSDPPILHLDLKLHNLLMDNYKNVKVADFGLSRVKTSMVMEGRAGTPTYMAPEMITDYEFDEKADVYSFGILVWELAFWKWAWDELPTKKDVFESVTKGKRPVIPQDTGETLRLLLELAWDQNPVDRPTFSSILSTQVLDRVVLEHYVNFDRNKLGWELWFDYFLELREVPVADFMDALFATLQVDTPKEDSLQYRLVVELLLPEKSQEDEGGNVTLQNYARLLESFGPLETGTAFLERIRKSLIIGGFHGLIETKQAERILGRRPGTFLIRYSTTPGAFAISVVTERETLKHYRIVHQAGQPFTLLLANKSHNYNSLPALIEAHGGPLFLKSPLHSKYDSILEESMQQEGYDTVG